MIRNGFVRHLQADSQRTQLVERWQGFPESVQEILHMLLQHHGLHAAQLATQAVEQCATWKDGLLNIESACVEKEERDVTPFA